MKTNTKSLSKYQQAKKHLKNIKESIMDEYIEDKPLVRTVINDTAYHLSREYDLTEHQRNLLSNYACKLHPKD
jgi:uncharacterized protein YpuA (DUF1002 family)